MIAGLYAWVHYIASHVVLWGTQAFCCIKTVGLREMRAFRVMPVAARRHAIVFPERVPEIIAVGKTADPGNFSDRSVRRAQKVCGVLKTDVR